MSHPLERAASGEPLTDAEALTLSDASGDMLGRLVDAAGRRRDAAWGRVVTYSPKVFLPLTNLCGNYCDYCSFRRSPRQVGAWTMSPSDVQRSVDAAWAQGVSEALFCLGDQPERTFPSYGETLAAWGHHSTVDYLVWASRISLARGLLPHTNAGVLRRDQMEKLRPVNASLGLMLECASTRLSEPGGPHHRAPDKHPEARLRMIREAGELRIPFTTGILVGIGETRRERVESLLAIRELSRANDHIQEVIVQNFTPRPSVRMRDVPEPGDVEMVRSVALARLVLDARVSVQAPPNLNPGRTEALLAAGLNDWGGISPVTTDYINPRHPWPVLSDLADECAALGFQLRPRLAVYERYIGESWLDPRILPTVDSERSRLAAGSAPVDLRRQTTPEQAAS